MSLHRLERLCYLSSLIALKRNRTLSITTQFMTNLAQYQSESALDAWLPNYRHYVDYEDYMAKNANTFNLIEYRLSGEELEAYDAWVAREKLTPSQCLNYCAEKNYKVSLSFSEHNTSWCASLTGKKDARFNAETTLTNWSDDWIDALTMAVYKASVIFEDGVWKTRIQSTRG